MILKQRCFVSCLSCDALNKWFVIGSIDYGLHFNKSLIVQLGST